VAVVPCTNLALVPLRWPLEDWYNRGVPDFRFTHNIQIRFADLDTQWHVNNARYMTFMEDARYAYITSLGLFDGQSFHELPMIVAKVTIDYLAPIHPGQDVCVKTRVSRLGNKSLTFQFHIQEKASGKPVAKAETIIVAFDYPAKKSIPIPENWRCKIAAFEGIPSFSE